MMSPDERSALADLAARLRRVPHRAVLGGAPMVEWLADEAVVLERMVRVAGGTGPKVPRSPAAVVSETRFQTGPIVVKGRTIHVERRRAA